MTHGSLFSGIGGFDLAAQWMGWKNLFHCEWNPFGQRVLKHYWPKAELFTDITKSDFTKYANKIDILTGGFPCQPYSHAGKRLGKEDERHLWPHMLRAIREIQPTWVVGENVSGLISWNGGLVFHEVQTDLEAEGYEVFPVVLPACAVNAPHRRDRVWFIAYSESRRINRINGNDTSKTREDGCRNDEFNGSSSGPTTNPNGAPTNHAIQTGGDLFTGENDSGPTSNAESKQSERVQFEQREFSKQEQGQFGGSGSGLDYWDAAHASHQGLQRSTVNRSITELRQESHKQPTGCIPPDWQNFPTQPPVCSRNDGLPARLDGITFSKWRNKSIKAYGNAIVPQVAYQIFKAIQTYEQTNPQPS